MSRNPYFDIFAPSGIDIVFNSNNSITIKKKGATHVICEISTTEHFERAMQKDNNNTPNINLHEVTLVNEEPAVLGNPEVYAYDDLPF